MLRWRGSSRFKDAGALNVRLSNRRLEGTTSYVTVSGRASSMERPPVPRLVTWACFGACLALAVRLCREAAKSLEALPQGRARSALEDAAVNGGNGRGGFFSWLRRLLRRDPGTQYGTPSDSSRR